MSPLRKWAVLSYEPLLNAPKFGMPLKKVTKADCCGQAPGESLLFLRPLEIPMVFVELDHLGVTVIVVRVVDFLLLLIGVYPVKSGENNLELIEHGFSC